jgi:hypothetical protein
VEITAVRLARPGSKPLLTDSGGRNLDIKGWLDGIGLGQYAESLRANDIDFDVLRTLTEFDLKELGLSLGDRKRLLQFLPNPHEYANPCH